MTPIRLRRPLLVLLRGFAADTGGATAIEYAMIAAGVGVAVAATVWATGSAMQDNFYNKLANLF